MDPSDAATDTAARARDRPPSHPFPSCSNLPATDDADGLNEDTHFYCTPKWVKNSLLVWGRKQSMFPFQCMIGPNSAALLLTFLQILGFTLLFIFLITEYMPTGFTEATVVSLVLVLILLSFTAFSDPGIVYRTDANRIHNTHQQQATASAIENGGSAMETPLLIECSQCNIMRPSTATHCYWCNVCVNHVR
jgi:hypothetical protein